MENIFADLAASVARPAEINVDTGGVFGNTTAAGVGILVSYGCWRLAQRPGKGLWGERIQAKFDEKVKTESGERDRFDWSSLLSFCIGFVCLSLVLGFSDNPLRQLFQTIQGWIANLGNVDIFQFLGMGGICGIVAFKAFADKKDVTKDMRRGAICALLFPLGGGVFSTICLWVGDLLSSFFNGTL